MATNAAQNPPPVGVVGVQQPPDSDANPLLPKKLPESDFVIVPSYSKWFEWNSIHECEIRSMPEFFDGTSTFKNPSVYKYLRNGIIEKFRANPATKITFTDARRTLVGDVVSIRKIFDFLDTWGLINFSPSTKQLQQTLVPRSDENKDISPSPKSIDSAEPASSERGKKVCSGCKSPCTIACFVSDRYDLVLCARCYVRGNYRVGLNPNEFRRVEITENVRTYWTEKETLQLMEAVMHYGDNWKRVAEHVGGGRTDKECVARFIKLPFGEQYEPSEIDDEGNNIQMKEHKDAESVMESSAKKARLTPLADASNPIMAQMSARKRLSGKEKVGSFNWNEKTTLVLLRVVKNHYYKFGFGCTLQWSQLVEEFNKETGMTLDAKAGKNKLSALKRKYHEWHTLRFRVTGAGWDEVNFKVTADDEWWERNKAEPFGWCRKTPPTVEMSDLWDAIFPNITATGKNVVSSSMIVDSLTPNSPPIQSQANVESDDETQSIESLSAEDNTYLEKEATQEDNTPSSQKVRSTYVKSASKSKKRKKPTKAALAFEESCRMVSAASQEYIYSVKGEGSHGSLKEKKTEDEFAEAYATLSRLVDSCLIESRTPLWGYAVNELAKKDRRAIFRILDNDEDRVFWIKQEFENSQK